MELQCVLGAYRIADKQPLTRSVTKHMFIIPCQTPGMCESDLVTTDMKFKVGCTLM